MKRPEPRGVRSFLAVLLPEALRVGLDATGAGLRAEVPRDARRVAWVRVENLHVTLRFLGSVDEATLQRVREALDVATVPLPPFAVTVSGLGGFPAGRAPRVIWAGITAGAEALIGLHGRLEAALAERGLPREGRPFHPHVTLGRARDARGVPELAGPVAERKELFGEVWVDAVHLMRSDLDPAGARYSVLARAGLHGARAEPAPRVDFT